MDPDRVLVGGNIIGKNFMVFVSILKGFYFFEWLNVRSVVEK